MTRRPFAGLCWIVLAAGSGLTAASNAEVLLQATTIRAEGVGASASTNGVVRVTGGSVSGRPARQESTNGDVTGSGTFTDL